MKSELINSSLLLKAFLEGHRSGAAKPICRFGGQRSVPTRYSVARDGPGGTTGAGIFDRRDHALERPHVVSALFRIFYCLRVVLLFLK